MRQMTKENLKSAFAGESQAHMKYLIFAEKAKEEGFQNIARLFEAIAYAERVHASNHLNALNGSNLTLDNLDIAIDGENFEINEMYPAYKTVADLQDEKKASKSMYFALEAEKIHALLYTEAKEAVKSGKDLEMGDINICPICGHTVVGKAPDRCPICGIQGEKFRSF
ncbi:MAG: rubrerythrin family protein [Thermodesulfovibrionales bacterium]|nr:rubrerythrin family protein [Thermodesulfovibrionales bacterium]